ncbi:MAG: hypothetical protein QM809_01665 [Gordonia sp. (in: high G+C Gram-positive bacteria)]|uniref:hypothetical protein n=1 Tax=Gordonia sp. (in: high G+C Gram-positive bacteria) TaxID=84139 RepID=UPI0039E310F6
MNRDDADRDGAAAPGPAPEKPAAPVVRRSSPLDRVKKTAPAGKRKSAESTAAKNSAVKSSGTKNSGMKSAAKKDAEKKRTAAARPAVPRTTTRVLVSSAGAVVLVIGTVLSVFFGMRYAQLADQRDLRAEYAGFAREVVVQMTTLDADNADNMYKLAMEKTSGRAQQVFRDNMKTVAELIRKGDAVTRTTVLTEAVSKATPEEGEVLMVVGWEHRSKKTGGKAAEGKSAEGTSAEEKSAEGTSAEGASEAPLFQTFRYQVGMTRLNGELKVTDLEFVW